MSNQTHEEPAGRRCVLCATEMHPDAVKCAACGAFSDWRRKLPGTEIVLALIATVLSLLTVVIPLIVKMATWNASTSMYLVRVQDYGDPPSPVLVVRVVNSGQLDAIAQHGTITFSPGVPIKPARLHIANSDSVVVRSGVPAELFLAVDGLELLPEKTKADATESLKAANVTIKLNVEELLRFGRKRKREVTDTCEGMRVLTWIDQRV